MAIKTGQRPTAAILRDPYALHRCDWDEYWVPDPVRDTVWTEWDFVLVEAANALDVYTNEFGQPRWLAEDPDVYWETGIRVDFAEADYRKAAEGTLPDGGSVYLKNPNKITGEFWGIEEWLKFIEQDDDTRPLERGMPEGSHAPTPEDFQAMLDAREERLARFREE